MIYIMGDCHIGANRRNKMYAQKIRDSWAYIVKDIAKTHRERFGDHDAITYVFAGDLWDSDNPRPNDLLWVKDTLNSIRINNPNEIRFILIPGNHDRISIDGVCPASIFKEEYEKSLYAAESYTIIEELRRDFFISYNSYTEANTRLYLIPYSGMLLADLLEVKELVENDNFKGNKILVSHFTTIDQNKFAGIVEEDAHVFDPYDVIIAGDCHICYDRGRFHTTGSSYMFNVDELYSKNCIPSYVEVNPETGSINRHTYPEMKPILIDSEEEAIDDDKMYLIVSSEAVAITKPNVFLKYKPVNLTEGTSEELDLDSVEIKSVNQDKIFGLMFPELSDDERMKLKMFAKGEIEVLDVISGIKIPVVDRTNQISEVDLNAEMEGLIDKEDDF